MLAGDPKWAEHLSKTERLRIERLKLWRQQREQKEKAKAEKPKERCAAAAG